MISTGWAMFEPGASRGEKCALEYIPNGRVNLGSREGFHDKLLGSVLDRFHDGPLPVFARNHDDWDAAVWRGAESTQEFDANNIRYPDVGKN